MSIYVKFNNEGHSVEMTNANPENLDYVEMPDDNMGKSLIKVGDVIRELTPEEFAAVVDTQKLAAEAINCNNRATLLLKESEDIALPDVWDTYTEAQKTSVTAYRSFLRNIKSQAGFPLAIVWPTKPETSA